MHVYSVFTLRSAAVREAPAHIASVRNANCRNDHHNNRLDQGKSEDGNVLRTRIVE